MIEMSVTGLQESLDKLTLLAKTSYKDAVETLQGLANEAVSPAQSAAPVKTGYMRDSIHATILKDGADFEGTAGYTGFQEFGTKYIPAKHFMTNAIEDAKQELIEKYGEKVDPE